MLRARGNDVCVVVGPFNEHMLAEDNRAAYRQLRDGVAAWLRTEKSPAIVLEPLASPLYADASHPLTEGYRVLAQRLRTDEAFQAWTIRRR